MNWHKVILTLITLTCLPTTTPLLSAEAEHRSAKLRTPLLKQPTKKKKPWQWYAKRAGLTAGGLVALLSLVAIMRKKNNKQEHPVLQPSAPNLPPAPLPPAGKISPNELSTEEARTLIELIIKQIEYVHHIVDVLPNLQATDEKKRERAFFQLEVIRKNVSKAASLAEKADPKNEQGILARVNERADQLTRKVNTFIDELGKKATPELDKETLITLELSGEKVTFPTDSTWKTDETTIIITSTNAEADEIIIPFTKLTEKSFAVIPESCRNQSEELNILYKILVLRTKTITLKSGSEIELDSETEVAISRDNNTLTILATDGTCAETTIDDDGELLAAEFQRVNDKLAELIKEWITKRKAETLTFSYNGKSYTITPADTIEIITMGSDQPREIWFFARQENDPTHLKVIVGIPYDDLSKEMLLFIARQKKLPFIVSDPLLYKCFGEKILEQETFTLNGKICFTIHKDIIIQINDLDILIYDPHTDNSTSLTWSQLSTDGILDRLIDYWHRRNPELNVELIKWKSIRPRQFCTCLACIKRPYASESLQKTMAVKPLGYAKRSAAGTTGQKQWECACKKSRLYKYPLTIYEAVCPECFKWVCISCGQLHYPHEQTCTCEISKSTCLHWFCGACHRWNNKTEVVCKTNLRGSEGDICECKNVFQQKSSEATIWECQKCHHLNWQGGRTCNGLINNGTGHCRAVNTNILLLRNALMKPEFSQLKKEYEIYLSRGGYALDTIIYIDPKRNHIIDASTQNLADFINTPNTYIKINAKDYTDCRGDGLCGYRAVTGDFTETATVSRDLMLEFYPGAYSNVWMTFPCYSISKLNRDIITLSPAGFTEDNLLYAIHCQGSGKYSQSEGDARNYPIIVLKACQDNIHFARLLPVYAEDPDYYYEKFTTEEDAHGRTTFKPTRINRPRR